MNFESFSVLHHQFRSMNLKSADHGDKNTHDSRFWTIRRPSRVPIYDGTINTKFKKRMQRISACSEVLCEPRTTTKNDKQLWKGFERKFNAKFIHFTPHEPSWTKTPSRQIEEATFNEPSSVVCGASDFKGRWPALSKGRTFVKTSSVRASNKLTGNHIRKEHDHKDANLQASRQQIWTSSFSSASRGISKAFSISKAWFCIKPIIFVQKTFP